MHVQAWQDLPTFLLPALAAPFVGSLVGVLILRLADGRPILWARSECESCRHRLAPRDLVPLASFAALRGRCRFCGAPIARFHLAVELTALGVAVCVMALEVNPAWVWADCVFGWTLLALSWIDLRTYLLPDALTLPLLLAGLASTWLLDPARLTAHAAGAAGGYLLFRAVEWGFRAWRKQDGLGQGDAKLLAATGAWLGWQPLPHVIFLAAVAGIVIGVIRRRGGRAGDLRIPFGPCIATAAFAVALRIV